MNRRTLTSWWRRIALAAPALALAAMLTLPVVLRQTKEDRAVALARNAEVQAAIDELPYRLGEWVGVDMEVPTAAVEILHPNAILSRAYSKMSGGPALQLLIVHCSDARDMDGHYPPNCYPAQGWMPAAPPDELVNVTLHVGGEPVMMRLYNFRQLDDWGGERSVRVFNYYLLPDGGTTVDQTVVNRLVERSGFAVEGVAQVQVVMTGELGERESMAAAEELFNAASGLLTRLGQGAAAEGQ